MKAGDTPNNGRGHIVQHTVASSEHEYGSDDPYYDYADYATDNNVNTSWVSRNNDYTGWIYVDLGEAKLVRSVILTWSSPRAPTYDLQYSNDAVNWTTIKRIQNSKDSFVDVANMEVNARYIRMQGVNTGPYRSTANYNFDGYALAEFEVYGDVSTQNLVGYNYVGDYTGYPTYKSISEAPNTYRYSSEAYDTGTHIKKTSTFNSLLQPIEIKNEARNGEQSLKSTLSFTWNYNQSMWLPLRTEIAQKASDGTSTEKQYVDQKYNNWGGLESVSRPLTLSQINDEATKQNYTTNYEYNSNFKLPIQKQWKQSPTVTLRESTTYDAYGRVQSTTNANDEVTTHNYSSTTEGNQAETTISLEDGKTARIITVFGTDYNRAYPTKTKAYYTNENGGTTEAVTTKAFDIIRGQVTHVTDAKGQTSQYQYDNLGRETSVQLPDFTGNDGIKYATKQVTSYIPNQISNSFDITNQNYLSTKVESYTQVTNINTNEKGFYINRLGFYDGSGNLMLQQFYDYNRGAWINEMQLHYDGGGRPIYEGRPTDNNNVMSLITSVNYDAWGVPQITDYYGNLYKTDTDIIQRKTTSYMIPQANLTAFNANPSNLGYRENVLVVNKDQWGRPINRSGYPSWPSQSDVITESYSYDSANNLTGYTDPKTNITGYAYDKLNRLSAVTKGPETTAYSYTRLGNLKNIKQTDGSQIWNTSKQYDEMGRLIGKTDPASQTEQIVANELGQVTKSKDLNQVWFTNLYDQLGRNKSLSAGNNERITFYGMEPFGPKRAEYKIGGGIAASAGYTYYASGLTATTTTGYDSEGLSNTVGYLYNLSNRVTQVQQPGNFFTRFKYDRNRVEKVQTNGSSNDNTGDNSQYANYEYTATGQLKTVTYPRLNDGSFLKTNYSYDKLNRLLSLTNSKNGETLSQYSYTYDNNSNITRVTDETGATTYGYDNQNRLTEVHRPNGKSVTYSYDVRGNRQVVADDNLLVGLNEANYTYDVWNQLQQYQTGSASSSFQYGTDGLRIKKLSPTETIRYTYNSSGKVITESDAGNTVKADYVWGPDKLLAKNDRTDGQQYYYLYNGHGDVVQITDRNGKVQNSYQYDEWGNIQNQKEVVRNTFKYAGEQYDSDTGLYYLRARYYDPTVGRFINKDTYEGDIKNPLSLNLYTYVGNNPLTRIDPSGHDWLNAVSGFLDSFVDSYSFGLWSKAWGKVDEARGIESYDSDRAVGQEFYNNYMVPQSQEEEILLMVLGSGIKTRMPKNGGYWEGTRGNGKWYSDKADVKEIIGDAGVDFVNGRPNFSPWSRLDITFESGKLNGTKDDFDLVYKELKDILGLENKTKAQQWLSDNELTPHHLDDKTIQLIPSKLHGNIPHIGSASDLRGR
nr:RHS repeat-associated core domain-containing protein [Paenibacillus periandrae]